MNWTATKIVEMYEESLNEQGPISIGTLEYDPAFVLKEVDPIAYRVGLLDYANSLAEDISEDEQDEFNAAYDEL